MWLRGLYRLRARWSLRGEAVALLQSIGILASSVRLLADKAIAGFKVHEDMGAHTRALDTALNVAESYDVLAEYLASLDRDADLLPELK